MVNEKIQLFTEDLDFTVDDVTLRRVLSVSKVGVNILATKSGEGSWIDESSTDQINHNLQTHHSLSDILYPGCLG